MIALPPELEAAAVPSVIDDEDGGVLLEFPVDVVGDAARAEVERRVQVLLTSC